VPLSRCRLSCPGFLETRYSIRQTGCRYHFFEAGDTPVLVMTSAGGNSEGIDRYFYTFDVSPNEMLIRAIDAVGVVAETIRMEK